MGARDEALEAFRGPFHMSPQDYLALDRAPRRAPGGRAAPLQAPPARSSYVPGAGAPFSPPGWVEPPRVHDMRGVKDAEGERVGLANMRPGDTVMTDRATVRIRPDGSPAVTLNKGYENGRSAAARGPVLVPAGPPGASVDDNVREAERPHVPFLWFKNQVNDNHPWDYKRRGPQYEAFGNFNYGATGSANSLPDWLLQREAGRHQPADGQLKAFGKPGPRFMPFLGHGSFGDDPVDQFWIGQGTRYHDPR
jgi:hypothetical protein